MLGCFNPNLGQIWTNPNVGLKMFLTELTQLYIFSLIFLTQHLGLSIFIWPKFRFKQPSILLYFADFFLHTI